MKALLLCLWLALLALPLAADPQGAAIDETSIPAANIFYVDGSVPVTGTGTAASPFKTIQEGLNAAKAKYTAATPEKSKVIIRNGTYKESATLDIGGSANSYTIAGSGAYMATQARNVGACLVIEGESAGGVILEGADAYTSWTQDGGTPRYYTAWNKGWGKLPSVLSGVTAGVSTPNDLAYRREMVFVNGKLLEQKLSLGEMTWGTFYVDDTNQRIYIQPPSGLNPSTADVKIATRTKGLLILGISNLVVRNLVFQRFASWVENDDIAFCVRSKPYDSSNHVRPKGLLVENVTSSWNNSSGMQLQAMNTTVRNVVSSDNGGGGIAQVGPNTVVENSTFERNGWRWLWGNYYGWTDGTLRFNNIYNSTFRNLTVRDNLTKGFWFDTCAGGITVDGCTVSGNQDGVAFEISSVIPGQAPYVVKNSTITNNGIGVTAMSSEKVQLLNNTIANNGGYQIRSRVAFDRADPLQFRIYTDNDPNLSTLVSYGTSDQIHSREWVIQGNTVVSPSPHIPLILFPTDPDAINTLTASGNTYQHDSGLGFVINNSTRTFWSAWRALSGLGGVTLDANSTLVPYKPETPRRTALGNIELQVFTALGGNGPASNGFFSVLNDAAYRDNLPRAYFYQTILESTPGVFETRGAEVVRGYLRAPISGTYRFWLSAEGAAEFYFNAAGTATPGTLAAKVTGSMNVPLRAWDLAAERSSDALFPAGFTLVAGQEYYFEIRHRGISDYGHHFSLAWQLPGSDTSTAQSREVIPASAIRPYSTTTGDGKANALMRDYWWNVPLNQAGALSVINLKAFADYPNQPHGRSFVANGANAPRNTTGKFGERIRGYITAPVTGQYKFWVAGNFNGEFWLSSDASPANLRSQAIGKIVNGTYQVWNSRADQNSSGQTPAIPVSWVTLTAGQSYYFELLVASHDGKDCATLAWSKPNGGGPNAEQPDEVIPASVLSPYIPIPAAPTALGYTNPSASRAVVSWTDNAVNELGYRLEQNTGTGWTTLAILPENTTSYAANALTAGTNYSWRICAFNMHGDSAYSGTVSYLAGTVSAPPAPASPAANAVTSSQINLSWTNSASNITDVFVERKQGAGGTFAQIARLAAAATVYADTTVVAGTTYYYRVRVLTLDAYSAYSAEASATPSAALAAPAVPGAPTATVISNSRIDLVWADNSTNEMTFKVQSSTNAGSSWVDLATVTAGTTSLSATGLLPNQAYVFRVRAQNDFGNSAYSSVSASVSTLPNPVPTSPSSLFATATNDSSIALKWTDNSVNETGFLIEYKMGSGGTWSTLTTKTSTTSSATGGLITHTVTGLSSDTTYYFRVSAVNANAGGGTSAPCDVAGDTTWTTGTVRLLAAEDSFVQRYDGGTLGDSNQNGVTILRVGYVPPDIGTALNLKSYVKFDASSFTGTVQSAALELVSVGTASVDRVVRVYGMTDHSLDGWSETSITWNNAPANASANGVVEAKCTLIGKLTVSPSMAKGTRLTVSGEAGSPLVTFINTRTGAKKLTFILVGDTTTSPDASFCEKDATVQIIGEGSDWQNGAARLRINAVAVAPTAPSGLAASVVGSSRVDLTWTDNGTNETGFAVERKLGVGGTYAVVSSQIPFSLGTGGALSYTDEGLTPGATYYYRVKALSNAGSSAYSNEASITVTAPAALVVENFDYAGGAVLANHATNAGQNGGSGWGGSWLSFNYSTSTVDGNGSAQFSKAGATVVAAGNQASLNNSIATRMLDTSPSGGLGLAGYIDANARVGAANKTLWLSAVITDNNAGTDDYAIIQADRSGTAGGAAAGAAFAVGRIDGTNANLGLSVNKSALGVAVALQKNYTSQTTSQGIPVLVVAKVEFGATGGTAGGTVTVYYNPDPRGSVPQNAESTQTYTTTGDISFDRIYVRTGSTPFLFDELRVGTSYASVLPTRPASPTALQAAATGATLVDLSWTAASGWATGYKLERNSGGGFVQIATPTDAVYTDAQLTPATEYAYRVRADSADGTSAYSNTVSVTTPSTNGTLTSITVSPASASIFWNEAQQLTATPLDQNGVEMTPAPAFTWSLPTGAGTVGASGLYTAPASGSGTATVRAQSGAVFGTATITYGPPPALSITAQPQGTTVDVGATASFGVTASNGFLTYQWQRRPNGSGEWANVSSGTGGLTANYTTAAVGVSDHGSQFRCLVTNTGGTTTSASATLQITPPAAPTGVTAQAVGNARVDLSWVDNSGNETGFIVERSTQSGSGFSPLTTTSANATAYTDLSVVSGTTYYYRVKATMSGVSSTYSAEASAASQVVAPFAYEGFNYATSAVVANHATNPGQTGGSGWSGGWLSFNYTIVRVNATEGSAEFSKNGAAVATSGNQATSDGAIAHRLLDASGSGALALGGFLDANGRVGAANKTLWVAVVMTDNNAVTNDYAILQCDRSAAGGGSVAGTAFNMGRIDGSNVNLGVACNKSAQGVTVSMQNTFTSTTSTQGVPLLLVAKIEFGAGGGVAGGTVTFYVNPDPRGSAPANATATRSYTTTGDISFDRVLVRTASGTPFLFDEIRAGPTYASVVPTVPAAPSNLQVSANGATGANVSWTNASDATWVTGYRVERATSPTGPFSEVATPPGAATTAFADAGLTPATAYHYRVRATSADGNSPYSAVVSATTAAATPLDAWRFSNFATYLNGGNAADLADPDHDGLTNLEEYALGGNPSVADVYSTNPAIAASSGALRLSFKCNAARTDLVYTVQASTDVNGPWTDVARSTGGGATVPLSGLSSVSDTGIGARTVQVTDSTTLGTGPRFLRLKITGN